MDKDPSKSNDIDLCGTLLPNGTDIHAGPNSRRFILRPIEHWNKHHKNIDTASSSSTLKRAADGGGEIVVPAKKDAFIPNTSKTYNQCTRNGKDKTGKKISVTVKSGAWNCLDIASLLDPTVSLFQVRDIFFLSIEKYLCPSHISMYYRNFMI